MSCPTLHPEPSHIAVTAFVALLDVSLPGLLVKKNSSSYIPCMQKEETKDTAHCFLSTLSLQKPFFGQYKIAPSLRKRSTERACCKQDEQVGRDIEAAALGTNGSSLSDLIWSTQNARQDEE